MPGSARIRSGVPAGRGVAQGNGSPSAAAGSSRLIVSVTSVARSRWIWGRLTWVPRLILVSARMKVSLGAWRMSTMSSVPSSIWAGGATRMPAPKYALLAMTTAYPSKSCRAAPEMVNRAGFQRARARSAATW